MGWLDRLFWSPDEDEDDEQTHRCDFEIVERGEYTSYDIQPTNDVFEAHFAQNVVIECIECGEQLDGVDYDEVIKRTIEWDNETEAEENRESGVHVRRGLGHVTIYEDVADNTE